MQSAMLVDEAAKLPAKRWAIIAPNYEYGQSAVTSFKALLKARRPDVEFVAEQWPALGKLEAASTVQAILAARPEAIFNVTFGADLPRLVREGNLRGLFPRVPVVSLLSGEPEYLDVLKDETPKGWIVTGYPWDQIATPGAREVLQRLLQALQRQPAPGLGRRVLDLHRDRRGAEEGEVDRHREADRGHARARSGRRPSARSCSARVDHQSTMGAFVGKLDVRGGKGTMVDWRYADGAKFLPTEAEAARRRPAEAQK